MTTNNDIRNQLTQFFSRKVVYHSIFWLLLLSFLTYFEGEAVGKSWSYILSNELINILFYAFIVYFNLGYLVPNYLNKSKFLTYCGLLIAAVIIVTPLKVIVLYFKFHDLPERQQYLVDHLNWYFLTTFVVAISSTIAHMMSDWVRNQREKRELEKRNMQSELKFLKSQINPHFLFNTLNSLYALTLRKSDKAPEIVIKLSEMMRYMLYECNERRVPLSKEVNYIRNYLDLERLRQGENADIQFDILGEIEGKEIAPLLFIPFIENSFKHGLSNNLHKGFVHIQMNIEDKDLDISVQNSKPNASAPVSDPRRSGGIGLVNVKRRLELLYPNQYSLEISNEPTTYTALLSLTLD